MPLIEFFCDRCKLTFEQLVATKDPDYGKCPNCQEKQTRKLISTFSVGNAKGSGTCGATDLPDSAGCGMSPNGGCAGCPGRWSD